MKRIVIGAVKAYRLAIAPFLPTQCRFYPTCSAYMIEALEKKGLLRGCLSGTLRILRCHPFHPGGYDPVR